MVEKGARVINNSWSITADSTIKLLTLLEKYWAKGKSYDDYIDDMAEAIVQCANKTAEDCIQVMIDLLDDNQDVLIVQSAGNDSRDARLNGSFCAIRESLFDGSNLAYFEEINSRILIVGAVENETYEGRYLLSSFSNYGETIDICAPGSEIFGADIDGYQIDEGTSYSAPMVTGAAALLWSIEPSLTASEVRLYLKTSCKTYAYSSATDDPDYKYPMLNVGAAVEALLEDMANLGTCSGVVYDYLTGEPIEGVTVTVSSKQADSFIKRLWDDLTDAIKNLWSWSGAWSDRNIEVSTTTNEYGNFVFDVDAGITAGQYDLTCEVGGYYTYSDTYTVTPNGDANFCVFVFDEIYMVPLSEESSIPRIQEKTSDEEDTDEAENTPSDPLEAQIASLVEEYGIINTGTETCGDDSASGSEEEVIAQRITGLLCADIYDYDSDGTDELMVLRVEPGSSSLGDSDYGDTHLIVSIYEQSDTEAVLADEKKMTLQCGLARWTNISSAFHLFRYLCYPGDDYQPEGMEYPVWLGLDYLYFSTSGNLSVGIVALSYDGETLSLADGIEGIEVPAKNYVAMYMAQNDDALTNLTGRIVRNGYTGWYDGQKDNGDQFCEYDFQSSASGVFADYAEYRDIHYELLLLRFGLLERTFRSNYGDLNFSSVSDLTEIIGLSPSELYSSNANSGDGIADLCSIQTPWFQGGITLICEDNTGLLDGYRY